MIALCLSPIYILFCLYLLRWLLGWMGACSLLFYRKWVKIFVTVLYAFVSSSLLTSFLVPPSMLRRILKLISNYWLGTLLYILLTVFTADAVRRVLKQAAFWKKELLFSRTGFVVSGAVCLAVILTLSAAGIIGAGRIRTTDYHVTIEKDGGSLKSLRMVLVADLHLGYSIGSWHMEQMVARINEQKPDVVVIAGDIFDNEYEALDNPERLERILSGIQSRYGVYACYGNHDIQEKILAGFTFSGKGKKMSSPEMDDFLKAANIRLLRDEAVLLADSVYLYGRPDYERPGRGIEKRRSPAELMAGLEESKPVIVLDHEPRELEELAEAGVDLDLCGHTHDGQMFPANLVTRLFWENSYGYLKKGNMQNIVTSGIGVFGPGMRVGTKSEICRIDVEFTSD
ncbi:MAG: metallophosphoesterase [Lachnospiraceae bacterium]|nr:metallophosphoesterase [Lachnospiraceae bacterium]